MHLDNSTIDATKPWHVGWAEQFGVSERPTGGDRGSWRARCGEGVFG